MTIDYTIVLALLIAVLGWIGSRVHAAGDSVGIQASSATGCLFDDFVCHRL